MENPGDGNDRENGQTNEHNGGGVSDNQEVGRILKIMTDPAPIMHPRQRTPSPSDRNAQEVHEVVLDDDANSASSARELLHSSDESPLHYGAHPVNLRCSEELPPTSESNSPVAALREVPQVSLVESISDSASCSDVFSSDELQTNSNYPPECNTPTVTSTEDVGSSQSDDNSRETPKSARKRIKTSHAATRPSNLDIECPSSSTISPDGKYKNIKKLLASPVLAPPIISGDVVQDSPSHSNSSQDSTPMSNNHPLLVSHLNEPCVPAEPTIENQKDEEKENLEKNEDDDDDQAKTGS